MAFTFKPSGFNKFATGVIVDPNLKYAGAAGGLATGLLSALKGYGDVSSAMENRKQQDEYNTALAGLNPVISEGKFADAANIAAPLDSELAQKLSFEAARQRAAELERQKDLQVAGIMSPRDLIQQSPAEIERTKFRVKNEEENLQAARLDQSNRPALNAKLDRLSKLAGEGTSSVGGGLISGLVGKVTGQATKSGEADALFNQTLKQMTNSEIKTFLGGTGVITDADAQRFQNALADPNTPISTKKKMIENTRKEFELRSQGKLDVLGMGTPVAGNVSGAIQQAAIGVNAVQGQMPRTPVKSRYKVEVVQ